MELFAEGMLPVNTDLPLDMCGTRPDLHYQRDTIPVQDHKPVAEWISVCVDLYTLV